jgi:hypothetical protein
MISEKVVKAVKEQIRMFKIVASRITDYTLSITDHASQITHHALRMRGYLK